jgi:hypothetical protein
MRRVATAGLLVALLFWAATPLLACVIPEQAMTLQERECCEHMPQMCGSLDMAASHSCCKSQVGENNSPVVTSSKRHAPVLQVLASTALLETPQLHGVLREPAEQHSPPKLLCSSTVLRI